MEQEKKPTLDFDALAALTAEERTAAIAAYAAEVEAQAAAAADAKYSGELQDARYASAKYKLATDGGLQGFGERIGAIEEILTNTPALQSLSDEDKLRTAYYIDRGMHAGDAPSAEVLLTQLKSNPEAMRLCEAAIIEKLRAEQAPALHSTAGGASVPLTPAKKPKSIDEASALARAAFGI